MARFNKTIFFVLDVIGILGLAICTILASPEGTLGTWSKVLGAIGLTSSLAAFFYAWKQQDQMFGDLTSIKELTRDIKREASKAKGQIGNIKGAVRELSDDVKSKADEARGEIGNLKNEIKGAHYELSRVNASQIEQVIAKLKEVESRIVTEVEQDSIEYSNNHRGLLKDVHLLEEKMDNNLRFVIGVMSDLTTRLALLVPPHLRSLDSPQSLHDLPPTRGKVGEAG